MHVQIGTIAYNKRTKTGFVRLKKQKALQKTLSERQLKTQKIEIKVENKCSNICE